jgi:hypothetical protein
VGTERGTLCWKRCLVYDRLSDSAIQNGKPSFLTQRMSIWPNDPAWFTPYVVILTSCNKTAQALPQSGSLQDQQRQVFEQYIQNVLKRHLNRTFSLVQTFSSPVWLAQQMQQRYLTEFQLGSLQADWLSRRRAQIIYGLISGLVFGLSYDTLQPHFLTTALNKEGNIPDYATIRKKNTPCVPHATRCSSSG